MNKHIIKTASYNDEIKAVALIHYECINLGFLSKLGPGFLFYLYLSMQNCDEIDLIVAKDEQTVIGFITGATTLKPVLNYMLRHHFFRVILSIIPHLFSIANLKKIFELANYTNINEQIGYHPEAELLSLAVKEEFRGTGVSQDLFLALKERFKIKEHKQFKIIVGEELKAAQLFYKKMGAIESDSLNLHSNSQSIVFKVEI